VSQTVTAGRRTRGTAGAGRSRKRPRSAPRLHLGRLAILALVLIGASFYVSPLRDFFTQQNRYQKASAELQAARTDGAALEREVRLLTTKAYIAQVARSDSNLVPPDTQLFVIKGLPGKDAEVQTGTPSAPMQSSISVLDRIEDLWRTLLH
jgi:cell division protein FtsB